MKKGKVLIVDDGAIWLSEGKRILEQAGYEVDTYLVQNPSKTMTAAELNPEVKEKLEKAGILLVDKDFGENTESTLFCCAVRHAFAQMPIIRWTGGWEDSEYMKLLGVTCIQKPNKRVDRDSGKTRFDVFPEIFAKALAEQKVIIGGPMEIFKMAAKEKKEDEQSNKSHDHRLQELQEISELGKDGCNSYGRWGVYGQAVGVTKHELGHAICDGCLKPEEVVPFMPLLKVVVQKLKKNGEIDNRFSTCAEFILSDAPIEQMELITNCY